MNISSAVASRELTQKNLTCDFAIIGGGLAGVCAAITAARQGLRVVLVQDRPVLGGNASSEVRLWVLGATTHMNSNNRFAREGGVINEILLENFWRNPEGNACIFDTVLLEKVVLEKNITLLLNAGCFACEKDPASPDKIRSVRAFCSQNSTLYEVEAPLFLDASGDGILGFLAGAAFRVGAEPATEFDEPFARGDEFGHLLGHSIYFYTRDTGKAVNYVAPSYALKNLEEKIPRYRHFSTKEHGCRLWWIEWGGRLDTVHETERIKWELWSIAYGVWDYMKNSGKFPETANLTLDWVGTIPGKRESRRFEGDYMLCQKDVMQRRPQPDAVAFGGWSIDLHPADGVYAKLEGSHHLQSKGIYPIPYRCYYSRNIENLFLGGRIISASHVAFGSSRVMGTCAHGGQAVAVAAKIALERGITPRAVGSGAALEELQTRLLRMGQHLIGIPLVDPQDLARAAKLSASSEHLLDALPADAAPVALNVHRAQMLPLLSGIIPMMTLQLDVEKTSVLRAELWTTSDERHHTPDVCLGVLEPEVQAGQGIKLALDFSAKLECDAYVFLILRAAEGVAWHTGEERLSGVQPLFCSRQENGAALGGDDFEIFRAERRPHGRNFAVTLTPPVRAFPVELLVNGYHRPTSRANCWVAAPHDSSPWVKLEWSEPQTVAEIHLGLDVDYDHSMESVLMGHPERVVPQCIEWCEIRDDAGRVLFEGDELHQALIIVRLPAPVQTRSLIFALRGRGCAAALTEVRVYGNDIAKI